MNIGEAASASGLTAKMIRHYEAIGLIPEAARRDSGYRNYDERDVRTFCFIRRARTLGFSLDEVRSLIELWRDDSRASADVKAVVDRHLVEVERKLDELGAMKRDLCDLAARCRDDEKPDCAILEELASSEDAQVQC
jgi:MerR family copper efflux transcriptional regulator